MLLTLVNQAERQEFCSQFCTHEWSAKQLDTKLEGNKQEVIDRVKLYLCAIKADQGVMAALQALIMAAKVCWPSISPSEKARVEQRQSLQKPPTLFRDVTDGQERPVFASEVGEVRAAVAAAQAVEGKPVSTPGAPEAPALKLCDGAAHNAPASAGGGIES